MSQHAGPLIGKPVLGVIPVGKRNHYLVEIRRFAQHTGISYPGPSLELIMPDDVLFDQGDVLTARAGWNRMAPI
jgi:hypothetical protein